MEWDWAPYFDEAFASKKEADAFRKEVIAKATRAESTPGYLPNWVGEAAKLAGLMGGIMAMPENTVVKLPDNWQIWLAGDAAHRSAEGAARLSEILAAKAESAHLSYPLAVRPGTPCTDVCSAGDPSAIAGVLADSYPEAEPSSCAVLMASPAGNSGEKAKCVVDFTSGRVHVSPENAELAEALMKSTETMDAPLGVSVWTIRCARGDAGGAWQIMDMQPSTVQENDELPELEKPTPKGPFGFDEQGRFIGPDGSVIEDEDDLVAMFAPTLDDEGELIEDTAPTQPEPIEVAPEPASVPEDKPVETVAPALPKVDGAKPPVEVLERIPSYLLPMYDAGESLVSMRHGDTYEFCVFDMDDNEGWAYSINAVTFELRLLREPSGRVIPESEATVRVLEKPEEETAEDAGQENEAVDGAAEQTGEAAVVEAELENVAAVDPATDVVEARDDASVDMQAEQPDATPLSADGGELAKPEPAPAPEPEPVPVVEVVAEPVRDKPGRTAYLATRPELEHVDGRTFGEFLSDLMGAKGIKPAELAKLLGVSTSSVYHYCSNSKRPSFDSLKFLTDYFDCNMFRW